MYETELASQEMRDILRSKEDIIQSLTKELEDVRKKGAYPPHHPTPKDQKESDLKDEIQGKFHCNQSTSRSDSLIACLRSQGNESNNGSNERGSGKPQAQTLL